MSTCNRYGTQICGCSEEREEASSVVVMQSVNQVVAHADVCAVQKGLQEAQARHRYLLNRCLNVAYFGRLPAYNATKAWYLLYS